MSDPIVSSPNVFVEFHALVSHAPSNLNRDDLGSPKSSVFGGTRRLRISSQCLKRSWRTSEWFRGAFADAQLGVRTATVPAMVLDALKESPLSDGARAGLLALFASLGKKDTKADNESDDGDDAESAEGESADATKAETAHLLYVTREEIAALVTFARDQEKTLEKVFKPAKKGKLTKDGEAVKALREKLSKHLAATCQRNAVDIALFGRFLTSDEFAECDAAMQVAHALGTEPAEITYDYFTAVDDESKEAGAGHLGETELAASVFYKYAVCDLRSLAQSLTRGVEGYSPEDAAIAATAMGAIAQAIARAVPAGKKNSTAPQSPADYVEVVLRRNAPISLANAFLKPVRGSADRDVMAVSIARLRDYAARLESGYSAEGDVIGRFVLSFRDVEDDGLPRTPVPRFAELRPTLEKALEKALRGEPA